MDDEERCIIRHWVLGVRAVSPILQDVRNTGTLRAGETVSTNPLFGFVTTSDCNGPVGQIPVSRHRTLVGIHTHTHTPHNNVVRYRRRRLSALPTQSLYTLRRGRIHQLRA